MKCLGRWAGYALGAIALVMVGAGWRVHAATRVPPDGFVHFVLASGEERLAVITKVVSTRPAVVNLTVFADWSNDHEPTGLAWQTNVQRDPNGNAGTWHLIRDDEKSGGLR